MNFRYIYFFPKKIIQLYEKKVIMLQKEQTDK